ncbi:unnamed protein product [Gadus morhua 'NCC']
MPGPEENRSTPAEQPQNNSRTTAEQQPRPELSTEGNGASIMESQCGGSLWRLTMEAHCGGSRGLVSGPLCAGLAVAPLIALIRLSWPVVKSGGGGMARVQLCQLERTCGMALHLVHGF